ncbi:N-acetylmuramoyl-L-alanine amidase [Clostridium sp.]|uniref:N-acetylmuramoyl-L-alanine amidase n=1 Tax=Clostridium sp. TaxID=1506 RepID=UPI002FCA8428
MAKKYLIALDDGHGSKTMGKRTPPLLQDLYIDGKLVRKKGETIKENEFNKAVVNYLQEALIRCGFNVLLVAPEDGDVPLETRVNRANTANADAYVSKHYNAMGSSWQLKAKGLVTIIHYNSSSTSKVMAQNVHEELWKLHSDHNCKNYGVRTDTDVSGFSLYVLSATKMPAILTESGFMDNMTEAVKMLDPKFQVADAEATCKGICKTFGVKYIEPQEESGDNPCGIKEVEVSTTTKYVKIKVDELNVRKCPSWDDEVTAGVVQKGEVFTVAKKLKVDSSYMYKLKSGLYITASSTYVESLEKI